MTARPSLLVKALNGALGLDLADFTEARVFLRSPEGADMLDAWLATRPADHDQNDTTTEETSP